MAHRTQRARALRREQTDAENLLWRHLRNRNLRGVKFRRQQPVGPYVADFCADAAGVIVELDGGQHAEQTRRDARRSRYLERLGYTVIRYWNNDVVTNLEGVLADIAERLGHDGLYVNQGIPYAVQV